ncbi:MAG: HAD family hydrolase [Phycisphaerales bacterium]|nr:MAG: HAD family hydrolase [Phycisphaerales bacterium]
MKEFEAVLFDVGDTILHARAFKPTEALELAMRPVYDHLNGLGFGLPPFKRYIRRMKYGFVWAFVWSRITRREISVVKGMRRLHAQMGVELELQQTGDLCHRSIDAVSTIFTVDADALTVVEQLRDAGLKLGLVSNTVLPGLTIDDFLGQQGFLDYFPVRVYSSDVGYMKPDRRIFALALDRIGVSAERTLFVGDRLDNDIKGASRVGMTTALYVRGDKDPGARPRPDYVFRSLAEVPDIILRQRS